MFLYSFPRIMRDRKIFIVNQERKKGFEGMLKRSRDREDHRVSPLSNN